MITPTTSEVDDFDYETMLAEQQREIIQESLYERKVVQELD